jgi:hypothetical protein
VLWFLFWTTLLFAVVTLVLFRAQGEASVLDVVPKKATGVLYIPSVQSFFSRSKDASWWSLFEKSNNFDQLSSHLALLDTLLNLSGLSRTMNDFEAALMMLELENNQHFVFYAKVGRNFPYWDLHEKALPGFGSRFELIKRKTARYNTFLLLDRQSRSQFNYAFIKGLAIMSFNREAFEAALVALNSPLDVDFRAAGSEQLKALPNAVLFAEPARLSAQLSELFNPPWSSIVGYTVARLDKWIALNVHIRDNETILNGLVEAGEAYDEVDAEARIQSDSLMGWLPLGTLAFKAKYSSTLDPGFVISGRAAHQGSGAPFLIFVPDVPGRFAQAIFAEKPQISSPWNARWSAPVDATTLGSARFSEPFMQQGQKVFVTTDGRLFVFSTDLFMLRTYIESKSKHLVDRDIARLSTALSSRSGLILYHQIAKASARLNEVSSSLLKYILARNAAAVNGLESVSIQLSKSGSKVYISALIRANNNPIGQAIPLWTEPLAAPGAFYPFIFTEQNRIIAFDSLGWIYGFSTEGQQLWRKQIGGLPLAHPVVVNHSSLKRVYFAFNTSSKVFLTDASGNQAPGFPLQLPSRATSGIVYAENPSPGLYVNCADRRTYAFNLSSGPLSGWSPPLLPDISLVSPLVFSAGEMHYVLIMTTDGILKIFDERGLERMRIKEPLNKAEGAGIHLNRTNSRGLFLTSGTQGELIFIGSGGISRVYGPERFSYNHYFLYDDFDADQSPDFMYVEGRRVVVYNRFNRIILQGNLPAELEQQPYFIGGNGTQGVWCFDFSRLGLAAVASLQNGLVAYPDLPKGERYGFGRAEASGAMLLGAYDKDKLNLFRLN